MNLLSDHFSPAMSSLRTLMYLINAHVRSGLLISLTLLLIISCLRRIGRAFLGW
jgi:hypothetical protein